MAKLIILPMRTKESEGNKMKNAQDLKKEYGLILRWTNGGGDEEGNTYPYRYYLEDYETRQQTEITSKEAIAFIGKKTLIPFRDSCKMYDTHVELFNILGVEKKNG